MNPGKYFFKVLILIISAFLFSSCISINRNITLNKDGSGNEVITVKFEQTFYQMVGSMTSFMDSSRVKGFMDSLYSDEIFINETRQKYDSVPGIKLLELYSHKNDDQSNSFIIKYEFDSVQKIGSSILSKFDESDEEGSAAEITFRKENDNIIFKYDYAKEPVRNSVSETDSLNEQMSKGMSGFFKESNIVFEIQFPYDVISSNADSTVNNKLIWKYSLSESMSSGNMKLEAVMKDY